MKKFSLFLMAVICLLSGYVHAQKSIEKVPYKLVDNFETGELFGWEPYPYAEDIGSNRLFFAHQSPTYNNSRYSLAGLVRANDAVELYNGFTKRLNFWTTANSRVQVAVYFQSDRNPEMLELSLGTFEGRRYLDTIRNPVANKWIVLDLPISAFRLNGKSMEDNEHVQVVTLKASYPMVYWLNTYTMLMDDFKINGERERRFVGKVPASTDLNMFDISILDQHFFYGDDFSLSVVPEENIPLQQVKGKLLDSKGTIIQDNITFNFIDHQWKSKSAYRFKTGDATGYWEIHLVGHTNHDKEVAWNFKFLMPGKKITGYPRLFFSAAELQNKLTQKQSPVAKKILSHALENTDFMYVNVDSIREEVDRTGENLVGGPYAKYSAGFDAAGAWLNPMKALETIIQEGSFRYAFIKDTAAGQQAKKALLKLCSFSKWNNNWMLERKFWTYYPVGYVMTPVAYGYDMLHDLLSEKERKLVRDALMEKGLKLFNRDMVEMNRMPSNITNHIAVLVSGSLLAATVLYGEDRDNPYMEPYLSGIIVKAKTFMDRAYYEDGSYAEPKTGYMNMATRSIAELLATLERNFGVDYSTTTNVQDFYKYPLQATHSNGTMQDFGDGNSSYKAFTEIHSEWFVHRTGNPFLYQYVKPFWEAGNGGYMGYLWYRDDIKPVSREILPTSKVFGAQGMVMRSGWKDDATVISTRVGPNGNHAHLDEGSFQVMTNGEQLLTDAGIGAGGYYKNLEYLVYNVQAIAHNTMLVDFDPESQAPGHFDNHIAALRDWPHMVHTFAGEIADAVESDLTTVYKDKLDHYTRTLLYTKSGPLFLFDRVKSKSGEGHVFNWVFHAPQKGPLNALPNYTGWFDRKDAGTKSTGTTQKRDETNQSTFSYANQRLAINRANARLTLDVAFPKIDTYSINDKTAESYIVMSGKPKQKEANFLAVIMPEAKPEGGNYAPLPVTTPINTDGWLGAKVERPGAIDYGFFRTNTEHRFVTVNKFQTDARQFTVSYEGQKLVKVYFEGNQFLADGVSIKSNAPITCAVNWASESASIEIYAEQSATFQFTYPRKPTRIMRNGTLDQDWHFDQASGMVTFSLSTGRTNFIIQ